MYEMCPMLLCGYNLPSNNQWSFFTYVIAYTQNNLNDLFLSVVYANCNKLFLCAWSQNITLIVMFLVLQITDLHENFTWGLAKGQCFDWFLGVIQIAIRIQACPNIPNFVLRRSYSSLSFYPINMEFGLHIPRVVRYSAMTFLSHRACSSWFIQYCLDHCVLQMQKAVSAYL